MKYYIDQSGKIEDTRKLTIVAYANGKSKSLKISSVNKRRLIKIMRTLDYPQKVFILKAFSGLVYLLLKNEKFNEVLIDKEYPGHEPLLKDIILNLFKRDKKRPPKIGFTLISKKSPAHRLALETYRGKRKPDLIVEAEEVLELFYKNKKGWSSHSG